MSTVRVISPSRLRSTSGVTLVELLSACAIGTVVLAGLYLLLNTSLRSLMWARTEGQTPGNAVTFYEYLSRDVRHASTVVPSVILDGAVYATETEVPARSLVLRLPGINAAGVVLPVYDYAVYTVDATPSATSIRRRMFTTRALNGDPVEGTEPSSRTPQDHVLLLGIRSPDAITGGRFFTFDALLPELAREVAYHIESVGTLRLRLRNAR